VAITLDPTTKTGTDKEITFNPLDHIFLPKMMMLWTRPWSFERQLMKKNMKNTAKLADALNVESKAILFMIAPTRKHVFALFKSRMTMIPLILTLPPHLHPLLCKWHVYPRKNVAPLWMKCGLLEKIWIFRMPEYYSSCSGSS